MEEQTTSGQRPDVPPVPRAETAQGRAVGRMRREYRPLEKPITMLSSAEALLRLPGRIVYEVHEGRVRRVAAAQLAVAAACFLAYGFTVGLFSGGEQLWAAPLKICGGVVLCAAICFPSLVIFTLLSGSGASVADIAALFSGAIALASLLLVGLGPVSWVFSQSTESVAFMGALHLVFWVIALPCGLRFLGAATEFLHGAGGRHLFVWGLVFAVVSLQMMTTLRPIVGTSEKLLTSEKKFFLTHWGETIDAVPQHGVPAK